MRDLFWLAVFSAVLSGQTPSRALKEAVRNSPDQSLAAGSRELTDSILSWFPADTETVLVAQQPFMIKAPDQNRIPTPLEMAQAYAGTALSSAERGSFLRSLTGHTIRLAVVGAKHFGESNPNSDSDRDGLGMIPHQGCAVYALTEPLPATIIARPPDDSITGRRVWTSKGSKDDGQGNEMHFVSLLRPDLMLACNHREFFHEVVSRMDSPPHPRIALPESLPEWKHLDRTAPVWALSHYSQTGGLLAAALPGVGDSGATGITAEFGGATAPARARMLAARDPWKELVTNPAFGGAFKSGEASPGIWEVSVTGTTPQSGMIAVLMLMDAVGFIVAM